MKKYKNATPEETIAKIRTILSQIGILLKDQHKGHYPFYSCRISIGNTPLRDLNIGTNGKGRSFEYSMASGYAEFMERLQNQILIDKRKFASRLFLDTLDPDSMYVKKIEAEGLVLDYVFDPEEALWETDRVIDAYKEDLMKMLCITSEEELCRFLKNNLEVEKCYVAPFYCVNKQEVCLLPIEILIGATGSNGMAAGNTPEEALVQGFCEIFERYAAFQLYYERVVPPTIPFDYFKDTPVYEELLFLKENTPYEIIIKDCSLQKGFPVIGVLFIDPVSQTYNFKLGADFVPHIALERCLTEIHQGSETPRTLPLRLFDLDDNPTTKQLENGLDHNFQKILISHSGYWPMSIFSDEYSYPFEGFDPAWGKSEAGDLKYCIDHLQALGYTIYIRDNSILGFPAYYIVIPGFSQVVRKKELYCLYKRSIVDMTQNIGRIDREKALKITKAIDENYELMKFYNYHYTKTTLCNIDPDLLELDLELFAFMLFYYCREFGKAKLYIDRYLADKQPAEDAYYFAISDYVQLKHIKNYPDDQTVAILSKTYGSELAEEVAADLKDPEEIFKYHDFPTCYRCEDCRVAETCSWWSLLKLYQAIRGYEKSHPIRQNDLYKLFAYENNRGE